jgi:hypothetical protein
MKIERDSWPRMRFAVYHKKVFYPVVFGPLVVYSWGVDLKLKRRLYLTVVWRKRTKAAYISPDATPNSAVKWLFGKGRV